ncbi:MAG: response regulator [Chloroflexi bacterium]|nr:response regulator [Chloroflexota bacterium]
MGKRREALEVVLRKQSELVQADAERLPHLVAETFIQALGVPHVHVYTFADEHALECSAAVGCAESSVRPAVRFAVGEAHSLLGRVAAARRPLYVPDTQGEPHWPAAECEGRSAFLVPVAFDDRLFGVVALVTDVPDGIAAPLRALALRVSRYVGGAVEVARLLIELRQANVQLQPAYEQFAAQERLAALGQMASGIVHDFNNVLTPIRGYAELLLTRPNAAGNPDQVRSFAEEIYKAACDAAEMVARLRAFYRPREAEEQLTPLDLNALVEDALRLSEPRWRAEAQRRGTSIQVVCQLSPLPEVGGLEAELRQALLNLIFNAVDAMPDGGRLTIGTRSTPASASRPTVAFGRTPAAFVCVEVSDTGAGMDEPTLRRCVEPFYSTKGDRGTGLGLASVYGTARRHDGQLEIESAPGRGTSVRLYLPTVQAAPLAKVPTSEGGAVAPRRIVVVDDEAGVRAFLAIALRLDGHRVVEARDAEEALALLTAAAADLLITDHGMPGMHGLELARRVKERWPHLPVILCTGYSSHLTIDVPLAHIDSLLPKPPSLDALRRAVARVLAGR